MTTTTEIATTNKINNKQYYSFFYNLPYHKLRKRYLISYSFFLIINFISYISNNVNDGPCFIDTFIH